MTAANTSMKRHASQFFAFLSLLSLAIVGGLTISLHSTAQDFSNDDEFLPVEEAYQVLVEVKDTGIEMTWNIAPDYYLYQERFKLIARNAETSVELPLVFEEGKTKYDEYFDKELVVHYFSTVVTAERPPLDLPYELVVHSMGCADAGLCYPPRKQYFDASADGLLTETPNARFDKVSQPPVDTDLDSSSSDSPTDTSGIPPQTENPGLLVVLLFAFIGGLILNLMPCVFPVLSLKALSFASAHLNPHNQHIHGWAYTAGVTISFVIAGIIILGSAKALGWGFQMQVAGFVIFMIYLFYLMGLSLAGMFQIGTQWMGMGQELTSGHGVRSSFFTGVLAALVASPCTGPLMAPALGIALTLPLVQGLSVFILLGLGMAMPFLLLSYNPKLAEKLPAPGQWMVTLKEFMAFPMFATAVWLLWVLGHQTSSDGAALVVVGGLLLTFAIWLHNLGKKPGGMQVFVRIVMVLSIIGALAAAWTGSNIKPTASQSLTESATWVPYTPQKLAELRAADTPVFIDLTADWCITCKFNERVALTENVEKQAADWGVVLMVGDWTNSNPDISALLKEYKRSGVPLYLMYPADSSQPAEVLPQILRESIVLQAMERAL